jgi:hypothetical protein
MSTKITRYLIIKADGTVRINQKPRLALDEIAVRVTINLPAGWGEVTPSGITIDLPDVPTVSPVGEPILPVVES